jgi:hypothetical protein
MRSVIAFVPLVLCEACGPASGARASSGPAPPSVLEAAPCTPASDVASPTYTELFDRYFAPGQPGHCATAHCHDEPGFNVWLCGDTKESCYAGMVQVGLVNPDDPAASMIGSPTESPLSWINPSGNMPFDVTGPFPAGRDAILAWLAACAPND